MATNRNYTVKYKRRRSGHTDYILRRKLIQSGKPRLVVRKSLNNLLVQIVQYHPGGDKVLASASSRELIAHGWKFHRGNLPAAYLTGYLCGAKAKQKKIKDFVVDFGLYTVTKHSRLFATLKGIMDAGLATNIKEEHLPSQERVEGKHIADYAQQMQKEHKEKYHSHFGAVLEQKVKPEDIRAHVQQIKKSIEVKWH